MALHKNNKMEGWEKTFSACQIWFILNWTKWFTRWQFHQYQQVWLLRQNILTYTNYTLSLYIYIYTKYVLMHKSITHTHRWYIYIYICIVHASHMYMHDCMTLHVSPPWNPISIWWVWWGFKVWDRTSCPNGRNMKQMCPVSNLAVEAVSPRTLHSPIS